MNTHNAWKKCMKKLSSNIIYIFTEFIQQSYCTSLESVCCLCVWGTTVAQAEESADWLLWSVPSFLFQTACLGVPQQNTEPQTAPGEQVMALHGSFSAVAVCVCVWANVKHFKVTILKLFI